MHRIRIWWQAFRYHFVSPSFLPAILGGVLAWSITGRFYPLYFILTVLGVTINHISLNMTDDYYDYKNSIDGARGREKNPYSGGSGTLTNGLIIPEQMYRFLMSGYFITILFGFILTFLRGWPVFAIGAFGIGCAYFYTAPPVRYGYHGFGEISQLINFSLTIGLGSYFVQTLSFSWEAIFATLPLGFMMFAMITINEIPDEEDDRHGGKRTLVVIFGRKTGVWLYSISMLFAYLLILLIPIFKMTTYWIYLTFVSLPWFIKAVVTAFKHYTKADRLAPANLLTIRIHNLTGILLIVAYLIKGYSLHNSFSKMWLPVITLVVLYLPVALTVFFNFVPIKPAETK